MTSIQIIFLVLFSFPLSPQSASTLDFPIGGQVTIPIPSVYQSGFTGRAIVLNANAISQPPSFRAALSVEAIQGRYLCSLVVLLGDMKVWASDHLAKFAPTTSCTLELAGDGDLRLKDWDGLVGWRTATSRQGVKMLHLEYRTGNLILADAKNQTKWQSFDHPTNTILWGERLKVSSYLTAFPASLSAFYSFEFHQDKIVTYLNWRDSKYSYWELKPRGNRSIAFSRLGSRGLKIFNGDSKKIAQISAFGPEPIRFLALGDDGNLLLYYYSPDRGNFSASYEALGFCDLPVSCGLYGICSYTGVCEHLRLPRTLDDVAADNGMCGVFGSEVVMVELKGVVTVLRTRSPVANVSEQECVDLCLRNCSCAAALYLDGNGINTSNTTGVCFSYGLMAGAKEVEDASGSSFWVKVPKEKSGDHEISNTLVATILVIGGVIDVVALCVILGGLVYYWSTVHRRNGISETDYH